MKRLVALFPLLLTAAGCCSIHTTNQGGRTMCVVENYGWRLFNLVPLVSGNPARPNAAGCLPFTDTVTLANNQRLLDYAIRRSGAIGLCNQNSYMTDEQSAFTFYRRTFYTSAELLFAPVDAPASEANHGGRVRNRPEVKARH